MRILRRAVIVLAALVACVYVVGLRMPREHTVSSRIQLTAQRP